MTWWVRVLLAAKMSFTPVHHATSAGHTLYRFLPKMGCGSWDFRWGLESSSSTHCKFEFREESVFVQKNDVFLYAVLLASSTQIFTAVLPFQRTAMAYFPSLRDQPQSPVSPIHPDSPVHVVLEGSPQRQCRARPATKKQYIYHHLALFTTN